MSYKIENFLNSDTFKCADSNEKRLQLLSNNYIDAGITPTFFKLALESFGSFNFTLNDDRLINLGIEFCSALIRMQDASGDSILDATLVMDSSYLGALLNSRLFNALSPAGIRTALLQKKTPNAAAALGRLAKASVAHLQEFIDSKAATKLHAQGLFDLLDAISYEEGQLNAIWHVILLGKEYSDLLLNSSIIAKLENAHAMKLLSAPFELGNGHIPLTYIARFNTEETLGDFLTSAIFSKLTGENKLMQYATKNDDDQNFLSILLHQNPTKLSLALNCLPCFAGISQTNITNYLMRDISGSDNRPLLTNISFITAIFDSALIVNLDQAYKKQIAVAIFYPYGIPDKGEEIAPINLNLINNLERFDSILCSIVFQSFDYDFKMELLGKYFTEAEDSINCIH